jgi:hypothetical protein
VSAPVILKEVHVEDCNITRIMAPSQSQNDWCAVLLLLPFNGPDMLVLMLWLNG